MFPYFPISNMPMYFCGIPMSMNTVQKSLDIPIDYYIQIIMEGFKDIVHAVGEVTAQNYLDFTEDGFHFPKGEMRFLWGE